MEACLLGKSNPEEARGLRGGEWKGFKNTESAMNLDAEETEKRRNKTNQDIKNNAKHYERKRFESQRPAVSEASS